MLPPFCGMLRCGLRRGWARREDRRGHSSNLAGRARWLVRLVKVLLYSPSPLRWPSSPAVSQSGAQASDVLCLQSEAQTYLSSS
jgi:hypothetical protein